MLLHAHEAQHRHGAGKLGYTPDPTTPEHRGVVQRHEVHPLYRTRPGQSIGSYGRQGSPIDHHPAWNTHPPPDGSTFPDGYLVGGRHP